MNLQNSSYLYCFHCANLNLELRSHLANNMPDCQVAQILPKYFISWPFTFPNKFKELSASWFSCHGLFPSKVKCQMTQPLTPALLYTPVIWLIYDHIDLIILILTYGYDHIYLYKLSKAVSRTSVLNDHLKSQLEPCLIILIWSCLLT